jgi:GDSL-like Lipase/Acylhydrolase family
VSALGCSSEVGGEPRPTVVVDASTPDAPGPGELPTDAGADAPARDATSTTPSDANLHYPPTSTWSPTSARVVAQAQAILARSQMRTTVFAKVGDSNTVNSGYFTCLEGKSVDYGAYAALKPTVDFFGSTKIDGQKGSFARVTLAAGVGWGTRKLITGAPSPVAEELAAIKPGFAIVMLGTNDTNEPGIGPFAKSIADVVDALEAAGVVPILSTIPPRRDSPAMALLAQEMNAVIRAVAEDKAASLVDIWRMIDPLGHPVVSDGVHLGSGPGGACNFSLGGLDYGMTMRNATTLAALSRAKRYFLDKEAPEPEAPAIGGSGTFADPFVVTELPLTDHRDSRKAGASMRNTYTCGTQSEGGREVIYKLRLAKPQTVRVRVFSKGSADHDLYALGTDAATCISRGDKMLSVALPAGESLLVVDSFGPQGADGEYLLTAVAVP